MSLEQLIVMHNAAIESMNAAQGTIDNLHIAMLRAKEAHAAAVKTEAALRVALQAAGEAERIRRATEGKRGRQCPISDA
jgi:hypothetical protein